MLLQSEKTLRQGSNTQADSNPVPTKQLSIVVVYYPKTLMKKDITITIKPEQEDNKSLIQKLLRNEAKKLSGQAAQFVFVKKSVDARHGQVKIHLRYTAYIGENPPQEETQVPVWKKADGKHSVIIVGSGPAGLFGALKLLEHGIKPVIIERGTDTAQRRKDIALISTQNLVNSESNYCFGEGGAGTFSDGKLYTRSTNAETLAVS